MNKSMSSSSSNKGQIQVSVRIKPFVPSLLSVSSNHLHASNLNTNKKKKSANEHFSSSSSSSVDNNTSVEPWIKQKCETFATHVWSSTHSQSKVYHDFMEEQFLPAFEAGLNCTCFLYGQTGSGKTYTIFGPPEHFSMRSEQHPPYWGIFPRCISYFLTTSSSTNKITLFVSMVELYQDQCYDLLNHHTRVQLNRSTNPSSTYKTSYMRVSTVGAKYDKNGKWIPPFLNGKENTRTIELQGQKEIEVTSHEELVRICQLLESARHTNEHALNSRSSRSHCIVNVRILGGGVRAGREQVIRFVDLAGSEKIKQTKASGQVLVEAKSINSSLSALGRVLVQLNEGMKFVSYRDSPLTILLQDALRGKDKTSIIVTVDSQSIMKLETRSTLNFAERCSKVNGRKRSKGSMSLKRHERAEVVEYRERSSFLNLTPEEHKEIELKALQNKLEQIEEELHHLQLKNQHGRNNPDFPKSTINTFTANKQKLQFHMNKLQLCKQKQMEMNGGARFQLTKEDNKSFQKEYEQLQKQIEIECVKVKNLRGLVLRQMTTGVWIPPKQSYSNKLLQKREFQKSIRRLNPLKCKPEINDDDEAFSTIDDLMLFFDG